MSISEKTLKTHLLGNLAGTAFLVLFGAVYEQFSHGVYSYYMIYAFAVPLGMGVIPYSILLIRNKIPGPLFLRLWSASVATISVGCTFMGVLEIYGTTNQLIIVYPIAGSMLLAAAFGSLLFRPQCRRVHENRDGSNPVL